MFVYDPLQNNSECTPFEEAITEPQEEEQPKTLLEVRDTVFFVVFLNAAVNVNKLKCNVHY